MEIENISDIFAITSEQIPSIVEEYGYLHIGVIPYSGSWYCKYNGRLICVIPTSKIYKYVIFNDGNMYFSEEILSQEDIKNIDQQIDHYRMTGLL